MKGSTLVELLISMIIGILIIFCITKLYAEWHDDFRLLQAKNKLHENARMVSSLLTQHILSAGYIGCPRLTEKFSSFITPDNKIMGGQKNGFDFISIRRMNPATVLSETVKNNFLMVSPPLLLSRVKENHLWISDCKSAEDFISNHFSNQKENQQKIDVKGELKNAYENYAEVGEFEMNSFYVEKSNRVRRDGSAIFSLFMQSGSARGEEIAEGVESFDIRYRLNNSEEKSAQEIIDWSSVSAVVISLELSSVEVFKNPLKEKIELDLSLKN